MGEVGKSPHVNNHKQALAIAYATARKAGAKFASGGASDYFAHKASGQLHSAGLIKSAVPGRTDKHSISVPSGSYIGPADFVSSHGEGNTMAGAAVLNHMFGIHPQGAPKMHSTIPHASHFADGGSTEDKHVPIIVAGGEYVFYPEHVKRADEIANKLPAGHGDMKRGHNALDAWVLASRKKHIKTLQKLPAPKK